MTLDARPSQLSPWHLPKILSSPTRCLRSMPVIACAAPRSLLGSALASHRGPLRPTACDHTMSHAIAQNRTL
eukprot:6178477-Pleurochrysis_carterae.AAC.1